MGTIWSGFTNAAGSGTSLTNAGRMDMESIVMSLGTGLMGIGTAGWCELGTPIVGYAC